MLCCESVEASTNLISLFPRSFFSSASINSGAFKHACDICHSYKKRYKPLYVTSQVLGQSTTGGKVSQTPVGIRNEGDPSELESTGDGTELLLSCLVGGLPDLVEGNLVFLGGCLTLAKLGLEVDDLTTPATDFDVNRAVDRGD